MTTAISQRDSRFAFVGGRLALDFTNTRAWDPTGPDEERLLTFADVLDWGQAAGAIDVDRYRSLADLAAKNPVASSRALERARLARELLHRLLVEVIAGASPSPMLVGALNDCLARALARLRLAASADALEWSGEDHDLDAVLHPVIWSAAQLLASPSPDRALLRRCANPTCGWLFVDESRNGLRKWCEMRECGNRAKARRHYARRRNRVRHEPLD